MVSEETGHLNPDDLAAYVAGAATGSRQAGIERHLTACDVCRRELIGASGISKKRRGRRWVYAALPAAAAAVLAGLFLVPSTDPPSQGAPGSVLRGERPDSSPAFDVVEPVSGSRVSRTGIVFRWRSGGDDPYYRITVTDEGGDVVWSAASPDTVMTLPDTIHIGRGQTYFWYVDALLEGATSSTSGIQEIVTEQ